MKSVEDITSLQISAIYLVWDFFGLKKKFFIKFTYQKSNENGTLKKLQFKNQKKKSKQKFKINS